MTATVALVTDFGTTDSYVAEMKLAIARCVPSAHMIDVTHGVRPFDLVSAALAIERVMIQASHAAIVAVVDPGVGTQRGRIFALRSGVWLVGPDNGVLPIGTTREAIWSIREGAVARDMCGTTFDGREIFGPTAAYLAAGMAPELIGVALRSVVEPALPVDAAVQTEGNARYARGAVIAIDHYGNAITNVRPGTDAAHARVVEPARFAGPVRAAYGEVALGEPLALVGSSGRLELAVREGPSGVGTGERVVVQWGA